MGLTWSTEKRLDIEDAETFDMNQCKLDFTVTFDLYDSDMFPRQRGTYWFADFAVYAQSSDTWECIDLSLTFDFVDFQYFSGPGSKKVFDI